MANAPKPKKTLSEAEKAKREKEHADAFVKLANRRVGKALASLSTLKPLANTRNYKFSEDQVAKIENALSNQVADTVKTFRNALRGGAVASGAPSFDVTK